MADWVVLEELAFCGELSGDGSSVAGEARLQVVAQRGAGLDDLPEAVWHRALAENLVEPDPERSGVRAERVNERDTVRAVAYRGQERGLDLLIAIEQHLLLG